jgi:hypothetical protein
LAVSFQFAIASLLPNYLSWHPKERQGEYLFNLEQY